MRNSQEADFMPTISTFPPWGEGPSAKQQNGLALVTVQGDQTHEGSPKQKGELPVMYEKDLMLLIPNCSH